MIRGEGRNVHVRFATNGVEISGAHAVVIRDGAVIARFGSRVAPDAPELVQAIEAALSPDQS